MGWSGYDNLSPFDSNIACLCQSIEINNNKHVCMYVECLLIIGTGCRVQVFSLILGSSVGLSAGIQSAEDWVSETLWVRILHSADEDNLSLFDSKIAYLCQSIEINNNKYVYRQSQVPMPNGSGVRWAECLLIIGTGCWVQVFAWSSITQSVCQQAFSLLKIGFQRPSGFESCIQQRKTTCLFSIRKSLTCARASKLTTTNMYIARARCQCQMAAGSGGLNACWS